MAEGVTEEGEKRVEEGGDKGDYCALATVTDVSEPVKSSQKVER